MQLLLQRVSYAQVLVDGETIGAIDHGVLVFLGVEKSDTEAQAQRLASRLLNYRLFADADDKMNLNVTDVGGSVLIVPQFTLAADTDKGNRPGFSCAAPPSQGEALYLAFVDSVRTVLEKPGAPSGVKVEVGRFGADMKVTLLNDGPVTFLLRG